MRFRWKSGFYCTLVCGLLINTRVIHGNNGVCDASWESNGDITIGIVANFHTRTIANNQQKHCSLFQPQAFELVEVVKWIFDQMQQANYIPGIKIGLKVYDACDRTDMAVASAVSLLPNLRYSNNSASQTVAGIIGLLTSSQAQHLVDSLATTNVPLVSPTATAASLTQGNSLFFRTIPSDTLQMKVLYNFIKQLNIKYFAIVSSDDEFGRQGTEEVKQLIKNDAHQICLAQSIVMKGLVDAFRIIDTLADRQKNVNQRNLPVLFLGQYVDAKNLIIAARTNERAKSFLWFFPDSVGVDASLFDSDKNIGRNVFSVSPFYNVIDKFKTYWTEKIHKQLQSGSTTYEYQPLIKYVENLLGCTVASGSCNGRTLEEIKNAYSQSSYINTVIYSAFVLGNAIKTLHSNACGAVNGSCLQLELDLKMKPESLIDIIKSVSLNHSIDDQLHFFPRNFLDSSSFQFDSKGNFKASENQSIYYIHNAKCDRKCHFQIVGTAIEEGIHLNFDDITVYLEPNSDKATSGNLLPSIYCEENCDVCEDAFHSEIHFASIWGENLIVAFVPIHEPGPTAFSCGKLGGWQTVEDVEAMLFGVETFNNNSGPWHGRPLLSGHLGIIVLDSCRSPVVAAQRLSLWLSGIWKIYDKQGRYYDPKNCVGIIGGYYSATSLRILPISRKENLIQVGYATSSVELPFNSPDFLRPMPADDMITTAMIDLLKKLGFTAFSLVHIDDSYGNYARKELAKRAEEAKLCMSKAIAISRNADEHELSNVFATLLDAEETKVVLAFTSPDTGNLLMKTANKRLIKKKFIWIGSDTWGARGSLIDADYGIEPLGMMVIDFLSQSNINYTTYMTRLKPDSNGRNMFFKEWWETKFSCQVPFPAIPNPPNKCPESLSIPPKTDTQPSMFALKAVYTMALGLSSAFSKICPKEPLNCRHKIKNQNAKKLIANEIRTTKLVIDGKEQRIYSNRGDGVISVEWWNVQRVNGTLKYVKIANYNDSSLVFNSNEVKYYDVEGEETSKPSSTCSKCDCVYRQPYDPFIQLNKNLTIGGKLFLAAFLPFHSSTSSQPHPETASQPDPETVILSEGIKLALKAVNDDLFGHNLLGMTIHDTFSDKDVSALQTTLVMKAGRYFRLSNYDVDKTDFIGVFTYGTGIDSKVVNDALDLHVIHLNVGKTVTSSMDDKDYFYNLGYTLDDELTAMLGIFKHYKWNILTIVYSASAEGQQVKDQFLFHAKEKRICGITEHSTDSFIAATKLSESVGSVIVLLIDDNDAMRLLNEVGNRLENKQFIAWSRLAKTFSSSVRNSYRNFLNNTIGISLLPSAENQGVSDLLLSLRSKGIDQQNPWREEGMDFNRAFDNVRSIMDQTVVAIHSFGKAIQSLMLAECGRPNLCRQLLAKPDWKNKRLSPFLEKDGLLSQRKKSKTELAVQLFYINSAMEREFTRKQIGTVNQGDTVKILDDEAQKRFERIKASCSAETCKCKDTTSKSSPSVTLSLIIVVVILVAAIIGLLGYIMKLHSVLGGVHNSMRCCFGNSSVESHTESNGAERIYSYVSNLHQRNSEDIRLQFHNLSQHGAQLNQQIQNGMQVNHQQPDGTQINHQSQDPIQNGTQINHENQDGAQINDPIQNGMHLNHQYQHETNLNHQNQQQVDRDQGSPAEAQTGKSSFSAPDGDEGETEQTGAETKSNAYEDVQNEVRDGAEGNRKDDTGIGGENVSGEDSSDVGAASPYSMCLSANDLESSNPPTIRRPLISLENDNITSC